MSRVKGQMEREAAYGRMGLVGKPVPSAEAALDPWI